MTPDADYPDRRQLIASMVQLLKAARSPVEPDWERFGMGPQGWRLLDRLANRLARHLYFEHLTRKEIRDALSEAALEYGATPSSRRPKAPDLAQTTLSALAREPLSETVYLGVEHLRLPHGTSVGEACFVDPSLESGLLQAFARVGFPAPTLLCQVQVTAGSSELLRDRAREVAETTLALVRQQNLFGFTGKIYLDQVLYRLDGTFARSDAAGALHVGWWRQNPHAMPMELEHENGRLWREDLNRLSRLYTGTPPLLRSRVDTSLALLDVAASSERWRVIVPAVFSAMEALLIPEEGGLKAGVVTVRSIALNTALGHPFPNPSQIMAGYQLRNDLVHGTPIADILDEDAKDFADVSRRWAFRVLRDYLELAEQMHAQQIQHIVDRLDTQESTEVCAWLVENGGGGIVGEYRRSIPKAGRQVSSGELGETIAPSISGRTIAPAAQLGRPSCTDDTWRKSVL